MKLIFIALAAGIGVATARYTNRQGKDTIVLAAPSVWDQHYKSKFFDIINFQIDFALMMIGWDNVIVMADNHTMPYLDGRSHKIKKKLPHDILLQVDVYDIHIKDYAPMGLRRIMKFGYGPKDMAAMAAYQIDMSFKRFLDRFDLGLDKMEPELMLAGTEIVDNGRNKALVNNGAIPFNKDRVPEWAMMIKLLNAFRSVVMIDMPSNTSFANGNTTTRLSDVMAFIDEKHLLVSTLSEDDMDNLDNTIWKKFRNQISIVPIPEHFTEDGWGGKTGICGLYTSLVTTKRSVYIPAFGNDPENWNRGHSTMMDKMVNDMIQVNTLKKVIPINVPHSICEMGSGLSSLAWKTSGSLADKLIKHGRWHGRRRVLRI